VRSRDEIRTLADSFNRMKKSVVQAMKMLEE
jgi:HAMP domain-containing protein